MNKNAFYIIDKPVGMTSFDVLRVLKKKLQIKRMGHTGTLDPLASGLLLVGVGNYTKLISFCEKDTKEYEFTIMLDGNTPSYDSETEITYISHKQREYFQKNLSKEDIENILKKNFLGKISQIPPKYSAVKIHGQKAYDMIRNNQNFEIKPRNIEIFEIEILEYNYPKLTLRAKVSAGTYIRSIAYDLGEILGTGGYISFLRRTKIQNLSLKDAQGLDDFDETKAGDLRKIFYNKDFISLSGEEINELNQGRSFPKKMPYVGEGDMIFVEDNAKITHIIQYEKGKIIPRKKI